MIYHFVNLVSWRRVSQLQLHNSKIFIDSISMSAMTKLCGRQISVYSGIDYCAKQNVKLTDFFLVSNNKTIIDNNFRGYALPWFDVIDNELLLSIINNIPNDIQRIFIGVSAPKQDILAVELQKLIPNIDIFCVGAALNYLFMTKITGAEIFSKLKINWLYLAIKQPKRFIEKIKVTLREIIKIFFNKQYRDDFISFVKSPPVHSKCINSR